MDVKADGGPSLLRWGLKRDHAMLCATLRIDKPKKRLWRTASPLPDYPKLLGPEGPGLAREIDAMVRRVPIENGPEGSPENRKACVDVKADWGPSLLRWGLKRDHAMLCATLRIDKPKKRLWRTASPLPDYPKLLGPEGPGLAREIDAMVRRVPIENGPEGIEVFSQN